MTASATWFVSSMLALLSGIAEAKTFQNSYVSFEIADNWTCLQEGVAWTCTPLDPAQSKEAVIVLAAKIAGPEDTLPGFLAFLKQPKKITTKVGTPMPSQVIYAQNRMVSAHTWVQSQHLGSEVQYFYTLYLATVKNQLAILVSFSAERNHYQLYNPIFDKAIKTIKIIAGDQLLFPKNKPGSNSDVIGIQVPTSPLLGEDMMPPPEEKPSKTKTFYLLLFGALVLIGAAYVFALRRKKLTRRKIRKPHLK